ncbi:MAG: hypothetical protein R3C15_04085 [Thermoleophilia bacterium]
MTGRLRPLAVTLALAVLVALAGAGAASASILVAENASSPTLKVAADGTAEVGWKARGARQTMTIPLTGRVRPGGTIAQDASTAGAATIPFKRVVRTGPNGLTYALQAWRTRKGGPLELRFSRWQGEPPATLELAATCCTSTGQQRLEGRALFRGKPLFGSSPTTAGTRIRIFVGLECLGCSAGKAGAFTRMASVAPARPRGAFALLVRPQWEGTLYRATMAGPNRATTYAPDVLTVAAPPPPG